MQWLKRQIGRLRHRSPRYNITVNVSPQARPEDIGREIIRMIRGYEDRRQ
jgi:hypothetical protein